VLTPSAIDEATLGAARRGDDAAFARLIEPFRRELRAHCYRMAGSLHDADDLLQESLVRVWRGLPGFEGRASLRTWLYKVTTHTCLDKLDGRAARTLPLAAVTSDGVEEAYLEPAPAELYIEGSPAARYERREAIAFAFLIALQRLTPKQRAALVLRDVVGLEASECAELLDLSVAAVNSALQRARETLADRPSAPPKREPADDAVLARYVEAWERADTSTLIALLREDARLAMPPMSLVYTGPAAIAESIGSMVFAPAGAGAFRLIRTEANGLPAFAAYQRDASGAFVALAIHAIELRDGLIAAITAFLDPGLFARFGLPPTLAV